MEIGRQPARWARALAAAAAALTLGAAAVVAQPEPPHEAQTIAQGVVELGGEPVAWRIENPPANGPLRPDGTPSLLLGATGIAEATLPDGDRVFLAPGEALAAPSGGVGVLPVSDGATVYLVQLLRGPASSAPGDGAVLAGEPFTPAAGLYEVVLARDVLGAGERGRLPASDEPAAVLVTAGIAIVEGNGAEPFALRAGEAAVAPAGAVLTPGESGAIVAAALLQPAPVATEAATAGAIELTIYGCPAGVSAENLDPAACWPEPGGADLQIFVLGSGANHRAMADAELAGAHVAWRGLPPGEYLLNALDLGTGYARFYVPGLTGINAPPERGYTASPNEGYVVPIGPETSAYDLPVYLLAE